MSAITSVKIRMYRQGFGDCFLLRFFQGEKQVFTILIDCGLKKNDTNPQVPLADVVEDIKKLVMRKQGRKQVPYLDVLVATHEHYDHVSAFHPSLGLFNEFVIDEIWMSWTENPRDKEARQINAYLRMGLATLTSAVKALKKKTKEEKETGFYALLEDGEEVLQFREAFELALEDLLAFNGTLEAKKTSSSGIRYHPLEDLSIDTMEAFDHIKTGLGGQQARLRYFEPGDIVDALGELTGVRIFVLGPPRSGMLNKDAPSGGAKKEVYLGFNDPSLVGYMKGVLHQDNWEVEDGAPFSGVITTSLKEAQKDTWLHRTYYSAGERWRTVDADWMDAAGTLALQVDGCINNSSLVLAIQLVDSERVLLFPGDAQVGSWLSWQELAWEEVDANGTITEFTTSDLLAQTILYKVAHHASHNGTLKALGLELMTHPDLVAFIPEKEKQYQGIPYSPLVNALRERTNGRVIFSADSNYKPEDLLKGTKPSGLSAKRWKEFLACLEVDTKYVEYKVTL